MGFSWFEHGGAVRYALCAGLLMVMPFRFGTAQGQQASQQQKNPAFVKFACQDQTVEVVGGSGTTPETKAIYLCAGNTVTWHNPEAHTFIVIFKKSPFVDNQKIFDEKHTKSKGAKNDTALTVYNYLMVVDGELVDDPQVIGGGRN
jgi:hypothetical protein